MITDKEREDIRKKKQELIEDILYYSAQMGEELVEDVKLEDFSYISLLYLYQDTLEAYDKEFNTDYSLPPRIQTAYALFELKPGCKKRELKRKYKELSIKYHPDKPDGDDMIMQQINHAYDSIIEYTSRKKRFLS